MGGRTRIVGAGLLAAVLLPGSLAGQEPAPKTPPKPAESGEAVFEMREVSAFEESADAWYRLLRGQLVQCKTEPDKEVKVYPKLKSKRPLYGEVVLDRSLTDPKAGLKFHFVLDESGETPTAKPPEKAATAKALGVKGGSNPKSPYWKDVWSLLTSGVPPKYDRLYFDANRDLDLTNVAVLRPLAAPPRGAIPEGYSARQIVAFDYLTVAFDHGPGVGARPFRVLPRLVVGDDQYAAVQFVATVARKGTIRIGQDEYTATLAQAYLITGRFDRPFTRLELKPVGSGAREESWWGADELCALREAQGRPYTVSATSTGDKLIVRPYRGDFGTFAIGPGKRDLKEFGVTGSIRSRDLAIPVGPREPTGAAAAGRRHIVPVGDYLPTYLHVRYGGLEITLSENYHSDGRPRDRGDRPAVFGMKVRKEKPFVLDFSNPPEVMFASPAKHQVFKPGDEVRVAAVLTDPVQDFMIRGLSDTTRTQKETYKLPDGKERSYERPLSLDPVVTIANSSGQKVATGKMPFG